MDPLQALVGRCPQIVSVREQVAAILAREAGLRKLPTLLITGETGTGKGLLARTIHQASSRAEAQFVELSGAAIPEHLLEAELFGYERGAFTDARQSKLGLLQVAHRGTLFLDEVALLTLSLQAKLLKVIEDGSVRRLGATRNEPVDVWIISATNEDLAAAVRAKRFREDLYHRLAMITLDLPPLRERGHDIDLLAEQALARACQKYSVPSKQLSLGAQNALRAYRWPGNIRELNSVIERVVLLCPDSTIPAETLRLDASPALGSPESAAALGPGVSERQRLSDALAQTGWNISRTATMLGITRNTVRAWIAKHGLRPSGGTEPLADSSLAASLGARSGDPGETPADLPDIRTEEEAVGADNGLVPRSDEGKKPGPVSEVAPTSPGSAPRAAVAPMRGSGSTPRRGGPPSPSSRSMSKARTRPRATSAMASWRTSSARSRRSTSCSSSRAARPFAIGALPSTSGPWDARSA